jgi:outer membrane lipoprotein-sorting protein
MTLSTRRPATRWLVPLLAAVLLAAGGSTLGVITAAARSGLPDRTAAQLLVDVQRARLDGVSGTVVQTAELGLPSLPGVGGSGSSEMSSLVSGSHTLRLWYAGPTHARLALLGSFGESDVIRDGTDLWTWSSSSKSATHATVPTTTGEHGDDAPMGAVTPQRAAEAALAAIDPSTRVSTDGTAVVAGRSAYELVLEPRDTRSLVRSVRIAIDGETHVPTRVQVFGAAAEPAFEVGFTSFDPTAPPLSVFAFNPPPGTDVTEVALPAGHPDAESFTGPDEHGPAVDDLLDIVGDGWTTVAVLSLPSGRGSELTGALADGSFAEVLRALPRVQGDWGSGHLLRGTLFSALLTDAGQLVVGPVPPSMLYAALSR